MVSRRLPCATTRCGEIPSLGRRGSIFLLPKCCEPRAKGLDPATLAAPACPSQAMLRRAPRAVVALDFDAAEGSRRPAAPAARLTTAPRGRLAAVPPAPTRAPEHQREHTGKGDAAKDAPHLFPLSVGMARPAGSPLPGQAGHPRHTNSTLFSGGQTVKQGFERQTFLTTSPQSGGTSGGGPADSRRV
jgi:hypothetical protein